MATFDYTGFARIQWGDDKPETVQFIDYDADTGTLRVWPVDQSVQESEFLGEMRDHPAERIVFLHTAYVKP